MSYQLCLGDESVDAVIDSVTASVCAVASWLPPVACRDLVDLIFRSRVRQTTACGRHPECQPLGSMWGERPMPQGSLAPAGWHDIDPEALPRMFAMSAASLVELAVEDRTSLEQRLAWAFRRAIGPYLFVNPDCGNAAICQAPPTSPFVPFIGRPKRRR